MPCYTVNLVSVEFKATSEKVLLQALDSLSWSYNYDEARQRLYVGHVDIEIDLRQQTATIDRAAQDSLNELKRAYSVEVVKTVAAKRRWVVGQARLAANVTVARKFQVRRY